MASERQIAANRRNAQRSTGPRTEVGKSTSRCNSLKHGLTGDTIILLRGEDPKQYELLQEALISQLRPMQPLEEQLVGILTATVWRLRRAEGFEAAILEWQDHYLERRTQIRLQQSEDYLEGGSFNPAPQAQDLESGQEHHTLGRAVEATLANGMLAKLSRHESELMRRIERLLNELRKLKSEYTATVQTIG